MEASCKAWEEVGGRYPDWQDGPAERLWLEVPQPEGSLKPGLRNQGVWLLEDHKTERWRSGRGLWWVGRARRVILIEHALCARP